MKQLCLALQAEIERISLVRRIGRIAELNGSVLRVQGLSAFARLGDRVMIARLGGEVMQLSREHITILTDGPAEGLAVGAEVELLGPAQIAPDRGWIGRIIDPFGRPLDGRPLFGGSQPRPVRGAPPAAAGRRALGERFGTGIAVFDTLLPLVRGQRLGLFAGSGVGKSTLLGKFARGVSADLVVIGLVGERGRELRDFTEKVLGPEGMARSIIVTATSDMPATERRRCAWTAMAVAEHFRDQGLQILLLIDSITRFAEAHREIALAFGEQPALRWLPDRIWRNPLPISCAGCWTGMWSWIVASPNGAAFPQSTC
jgi:flagellum-specific ATP synthase